MAGHLCRAAWLPAVVAFLLVPPGLRTWPPQSTVPQDSVLGIFEGRTPCGPIALHFTGFPAQNCEKIKWKLTLYLDRASGAPARYEFKGSRATRQGAVTVAHVTPTSRDAVVYNLAFERPSQVLHLQSIENRILLLLDDGLHPLVGDASWSYTLNRTAP